MITIYHLETSRSERIVWLMEELGLEYELDVYPRETTGAAPHPLQSIHPLGKAPVIRDGDTLLADTWTKELELAADYSAAVWLTRLGVTRDQLLQAFDALSFPVESQTGYPTRAERRAKVVQGNADSSNAISGTVPDVIIQPPPPQPQTFPVYIVVRHHWINNKKLGVVNSGTITIRIDDALDYKFDVTENFQDQRVDLTAGQHEVEFAANVRAENWNTGIHATGKCLQSLQISKSATFEPYIAFDERGNILSCGMKPIKQ